ncbi:hypothetical protein C7212DRAFT_365174 [Tuber magnatum]|uniref:Uncharacterized protein n=1 Tax=Tuber magnatum TaxID=42249 RepID=A0A317SLY7_9PEZI|nr:hypothetical protein C7212DRAFT_365174 [Tuber magnatum]
MVSMISMTKGDQDQLGAKDEATEQYHHYTRSEEHSTDQETGDRAVHLDGSGMSDTSRILETTLSDTSTEARARERELRERAEVQVPATQAAQVTVRLEDEVHDIRDDVRRLATRFDGLEERMDESDRRIDERFDTIKEWTEGMKEWTVGVAGTLQTILEKLSDIDSRVGRVERKLTD